MNNPILVFPDLNHMYVLFINASKQSCLGAVMEERATVMKNEDIKMLHQNVHGNIGQL